MGAYEILQGQGSQVPGLPQAWADSPLPSRLDSTGLQACNWAGSTTDPAKACQGAGAIYPLLVIRSTLEWTQVVLLRGQSNPWDCTSCPPKAGHAQTLSSFHHLSVAFSLQDLPDAFQGFSGEIPSLYIPCHSPSFARDLGAQERVKSLHTPTF